MNNPILNIEKIVLKNITDETIRSPCLYCIDNITAIDAVGRAIAKTVSLIKDEEKPSK